MYELHPPAPDLAPFIEHYWLLRSTDEAPVDLRVNVYVDARADLILNYGVPYVRTVIGGERREISASNLDAQRLEPICIEQRGAIHAPGRTFTPRVVALEAPARMVWQDGFFPMFQGTRTFTLTPTAAGSRFEMCEVFRGVMLPMIKGSLPDMSDAFAQFADDLAAVCGADGA